jgi:hypothetical protein
MLMSRTCFTRSVPTLLLSAAIAAAPDASDNANAVPAVTHVNALMETSTRSIQPVSNVVALRLYKFPDEGRNRLLFAFQRPAP